MEIDVVDCCWRVLLERLEISLLDLLRMLSRLEVGRQRVNLTILVLVP